MLVASLSPNLIQVSHASVTEQEHELAYDDGTPESSIALPYYESIWGYGEQEWIGHNMLAVMFTSSTPQELLRVRFYVTGQLAYFQVRLFDSGRQYLFFRKYVAGGPTWINYAYLWSVMPKSPGWVDVDVSNRTIIVSGDFYVAVEFATDMKPSIGVDSSSLANRSWYVENKTYWESYSNFTSERDLPNGNVMIRAVLGSFENSTDTLSSSSTSSTIVPTFPTSQTPSIAVAFGSVVAVVALGLAVFEMVRRRKRQR